MSILRKATPAFFLDSRAVDATQPAAEELEFRILTPGDFQAFRAIRLEALSGPDARYFGASYEAESTQSDSEWSERCRETKDGAIFAVFVNHRIAGVMAATKSDKYDRTVLWGSVYLEPVYRKKHIAEKLYQMRQQWSEASGLFDRAIFFIREGNERSTAIHLKNGARIIDKEEMTFADHSRGPALWFEKTLRAEAIATCTR